MNDHSPPNKCLYSSAPIAAFRKRDKHEKDDIVQERIPQGQHQLLSCAEQLPNNVFFFLNVFFFILMISFLFPDDPMPRQSSQVQAAEDILDKYRNIKRSSPSDGAAGGTSYDGTGGEKETACQNIPGAGAVDLILLL